MRTAEARLQWAQTEYQTKWAGIGAQLEAKKSALAELKNRLGIITGLLAGRYLYPHFMADMANAMPSEVNVTSITTAKDANGIKVTANATSSSAPGVTHWMRTMQKPGLFGTFGEPTVSAIAATMDSNTNTKNYNFSMIFPYSPK
jgi:Tfp pilus assembly protein PilN